MKVHSKSAICVALLAFAANACGGRGGSKIERNQQEYGVVQEAHANGVSGSVGDTVGTTTVPMTGTNKDSSSNFAVVGTPVSTDIVPANGQPAAISAAPLAPSTTPQFDSSTPAAPPASGAAVTAARRPDGRIAITQTPARNTAAPRRTARRDEPATDTRAPEQSAAPAETVESHHAAPHETAPNPNPPAATDTQHGMEPKPAPAPATDTAPPEQTETAEPPPPPPPTTTR